MASYEQSKSSKLWSVRFRIANGNEKKHMRLSGYRTKKEAQQGYLDFMSSYAPDEPVKNDSFLFYDLFEEYCLYAKSRMKESSYYDFTSKANLHILPYFKDFSVKEIKPLDVVHWQNGLTTQSYKYKCNLRGYLSSILKYAEMYHDIPNPVKKVEYIRNVEMPKEMHFWTEVEFKKFINEVDRIDHKSFFSFLYFTGCRRGEALALNWEDFDFANAKVRINKSITRKIEGKSWLVTTPKNASSIRTISLPANLLSLLEEYREWQKQKYPDAIFVFGSYAPFAGTNIDRSFSEFCKKANVERIRIHDLRHSHASFLISKGISVVAIAKRLGHKNIEQTLNTYSHMMPDEDKKLIEYLENI